MKDGQHSVVVERPIEYHYKYTDCIWKQKFPVFDLLKKKTV